VTVQVVIDPGVYNAATLSPSGTPAQLMRRWRRRQFDMIVSSRLTDCCGQPTAIPAPRQPPRRPVVIVQGRAH